MSLPPAPDHHDDDHDRGLASDLETMNRRRMLGFLGLGSLAVMSAPAAAAARALVPAETAGPYPADGSNGVDVLDDTGIVRRDIRRSFGGATGVAAGVPLLVNLILVDTAGRPLPGRAVYLWQADALGRYSMYSTAIRRQNYLRGVQAAGSTGRVQFLTIYPGCYSGRWPHIHFEVYRSVSAATNDGPIVRTSQLALPKAVSQRVYARSAYKGSAANLARISLASDNVFGNDHAARQMATVTGTVGTRLVATLTVAVPR